MMKKQAINGMEGDQAYLNKTPMAEVRPSVIGVFDRSTGAEVLLFVSVPQLCRHGSQCPEQAVLFGVGTSGEK